MPRVKLGRKPNDEVLISLLWGRQVAMGMPVGTMAEKAGMTPQTLRSRKKSPQDFSLKELLKLGRALDIPIEELRDAIRY